MKNAKEKLDEKLGIKDIGDIFNQCDIDEILKDSKIEIDKIDNQIKSKALDIDNLAKNIPNEKTTSSLTTVDKNSDALLVKSDSPIYTMEESLSEISHLISKSKLIITNLYEYITNTNFVDPDIISATAKMIEASRIVISDYIELYKEKLRMIHSYNMEMQKHKNRLEFEAYKAELKYKYSIKDDVIETDDIVNYSQEAIIIAMRDAEKQNSITTNVI